MTQRRMEQRHRDEMRRVTATNPNELMSSDVPLTVNGNSIVRSGASKDLCDFDITYRTQDMRLEQIRTGRTGSEGGQLAR